MNSIFHVYPALNQVQCNDGWLCSPQFTNLMVCCIFLFTSMPSPLLPLRTKRFSRAVIFLVPLLVRSIRHIITPDDGDDYTAAVRWVGYLAGVRPFLLRKVQQLCRPSSVRVCVRRRLWSERSVSNENVKIVQFSLFSELRSGHCFSP